MESSELLFHDPDITVHDRITMALQINHIRARAFLDLARRSVSQLQIVMDQNPILANGDSGIFHLLVALKDSSGEIHIVSLPG